MDWICFHCDNLGMERPNQPANTLKLLIDPDHCLMYGAFIRASRNLLGLNQGDFAQFLGVTRATLFRLENGVAPLKKSLCEAAVDLLKTAGIESKAMDELRYTIGVPTTLDISVNYGTLLHAFSHLPRNAETQEKIRALFGERFVAPLKETPLRRK